MALSSATSTISGIIAITTRMTRPPESDWSRRERTPELVAAVAIPGLRYVEDCIDRQTTSQGLEQRSEGRLPPFALPCPSLRLCRGEHLRVLPGVPVNVKAGEVLVGHREKRVASGLVLLDPLS